MGYDGCVEGPLTDGHQTALGRFERTGDLTPAPTATNAQKAKPGPGLSVPVPGVPWATVRGTSA